MNFESLANELLLDLFEFLSTTQLLHSFHCLNSRFNRLLLDHFCTHNIDFRSISKQNFEIVCQQYLPLIRNRILSLRLSDDNDTPQQINSFLSYGFNFYQFSSLQSLSFRNLCFADIMNRMMIELHDLSNLTHLTFEHCHFEYNRTQTISFLNNIWSLPKLLFCYFDIEFQYENIFYTQIKISSSFEPLSIESTQYSIQSTSSLFEYKRSIRHLIISFDCDSFTEYLTLASPSIITLNVSFYWLEENLAINFLQNMSNLCQLKLYVRCFYIDGYQWEQMIRNHLPKLKIFQFKIESKLVRNNTRISIDDIIQTFRSRFWLEERHWFVRCDLNITDARFLLYTLPYAFDKYDVDDYVLSKSTCSQDDDVVCYNRVHTLNFRTFLSEQLIVSNFHFDNLCHISIELPVNDHFWLIVSKFDRLISLSLWSYDWNDENCRIQLQMLLDRAPNLYSLSFEDCSTFSLFVPPFSHTSISTHELDLRLWNRFYNSQQCNTLSQSPLGIQCKILHIYVENRICILNIVKSMINLQAMKVHSKDDTIREKLSTIEDELVEWLRHHLPSTCMIARDSQCMIFIQLWIR